MSVKLFVSYAHKDEKYKEDLEEHLSPLIRSNLIASWHDRKIMPGTKWKDEIDSHLKEADIILFLVSSSFINSDYCQEIEVRTAVEQHNSGQSVLIPVVIRACHWQGLDFASFQGLPKDALAVKSWSDEDEAWLNVTKGIEEAAIDITQKKTLLKVEIPINNSEFEVTDNFLSWLNDTEVKLSHRLVGDVKLQDIYVVPDIQEYDEDTEKLIDISSSETVLNRKENFIIFGDEQVGKTSLLKYYYIELLKKKEVCIYLDSRKINKNFKTVVRDALDFQYESINVEKFLGLERKTILIDDFDKIALNQKNIISFVAYLEEVKSRIIILCETNLSYISNDISCFDNFEKPKLIELGHQKRENLINKWVSLGKKESISSEEDTYHQTDLIKIKIDSILKKNIVPARPIYILMVLQMFEAQKKLNIELTSYGHCYQQLIYSNFEAGKIVKEQYEKYWNVLTELAWWIFNNNKGPNLHQMDLFFDEYEEKYLYLDRKLVIESLIKCSLIVNNNIEYSFKYPYIYYFFAAKKIADAYIESDEVKEATDMLLENLHKEDFANILIFVTHHTKNSWILDKIKNCLSKQFNMETKYLHLWRGESLEQWKLTEKDFEYTVPFIQYLEPIREADFSRKQLKFIQNFMIKIPELVIEQREFSHEREKRNSYLDNHERESTINKIDEEDVVSSNILSDVNRVFKSMEIAGQIINNRHASLPKLIIKDLATDGIDAGLRFLNFFINISDKAQESIIRVIAENIAMDPDMTNSDIKGHAEQAYLFLTYNVLYATVQKIAHSIGSKEAIEIYKNIEDDKSTSAHSLIKLSIDIQFNKNLDIQEIIKLNKKFSNNTVCQRLMKQFIIQHIYMYPVPFKEKQQISEILGITLLKQRWMEAESKGKYLRIKDSIT